MAASNIRVAVRCRPFLSNELPEQCLSLTPDSATIVNPTTGAEKTFTYDRCYTSVGYEDDPHALTTQEDIYEELGTWLLDNSFGGYNTSIFAYGQTGSGKTHTMMGDGWDENKGEDHMGLIPRICGAHINRMTQLKEEEAANTVSSSSGHETARSRKGGESARLSGGGHEAAREKYDDCVEKAVESRYRMVVTFAELYMEQAYDLLAPSAMQRGVWNAAGSANGPTQPANPNLNRQSLRLREHPVTGPFIEGLREVEVRTLDEMRDLMATGLKSRTQAATRANQNSSRSHAIFTMMFSQAKVATDTGVAIENKVSKVSLVDLAGSERADITGITGNRLREASNINRGLLTLGRVITALIKGTAPQNPARSHPSSGDLSPTSRRPTQFEVVPYRDSVLTWLLKESLGGNAKTAMIAAVSPSSTHFEETLSTLTYADCARGVVNRAVVNEDPTAALIRQLRAELATCKQQLAHYHMLAQGGGRVGGMGTHSPAPPADRPLLMPARNSPEPKPDKNRRRSLGDMLATANPPRSPETPEQQVRQEDRGEESSLSTSERMIARRPRSVSQIQKSTPPAGDGSTSVTDQHARAQSGPVEKEAATKAELLDWKAKFEGLRYSYSIHEEYDGLPYIKDMCDMLYGEEQAVMDQNLRSSKAYTLDGKDVAELSRLNTPPPTHPSTPTGEGPDFGQFNSQFLAALEGEHNSLGVEVKMRQQTLEQQHPQQIHHVLETVGSRWSPPEGTTVILQSPPRRSKVKQSYLSHQHVRAASPPTDTAFIEGLTNARSAPESVFCRQGRQSPPDPTFAQMDRAEPSSSLTRAPSLPFQQQQHSTRRWGFSSVKTELQNSSPSSSGPSMSTSVEPKREGSVFDRLFQETISSRGKRKSVKQKGGGSSSNSVHSFFNAGVPVVTRRSRDAANPDMPSPPESPGRWVESLRSVRRTTSTSAGLERNTHASSHASSAVISATTTTVINPLPLDRSQRGSFPNISSNCNNSYGEPLQLQPPAARSRPVPSLNLPARLDEGALSLASHPTVSGNPARGSAGTSSAGSSATPGVATIGDPARHVSGNRAQRSPASSPRSPNVATQLQPTSASSLYASPETVFPDQDDSTSGQLEALDARTDPYLGGGMLPHPRATAYVASSSSATSMVSPPLAPCVASSWSVSEAEACKEGWMRDPPSCPSEDGMGGLHTHALGASAPSLIDKDAAKEASDIPSSPASKSASATRAKALLEEASASSDVNRMLLENLQGVRSAGDVAPGGQGLRPEEGSPRTPRNRGASKDEHDLASPVFEGNLMKQTKLMRRWQVRTVRVEGDMLTVWKSAESPQPKRSVNLRGVQVVDTFNSKVHSFELTAPGMERIFFKADNLESKQRWMKLFRHFQEGSAHAREVMHI